MRYTARPDAQGHARADLAFPSVPGTRYRVFASTETTLLKALDQSGTAAATAAAVSIRAAAQGAPRAEAFKAAKGLFGWNCFECLTDQPLIASAATTAFTHRLSASLDVLAIYRILGEGPSGALSEMTDADLIPFAVPNLGGPSQPHISLLNAGLDPTTQGVRLAVKVPAGKAQPVAWRLRRSSVPVGDPLAMNLVAQGAVSGATTIDSATAFEIDATEPLKAWRRYRFAVQVQSGPPPGAPTVGVIPAGEWSEASAAVPLAVVPPAAPAPPSAVSIANDGATPADHHNSSGRGLASSYQHGHFHLRVLAGRSGRSARAALSVVYPRAGATWLAADTRRGVSRHLCDAASDRSGWPPQRRRHFQPTGLRERDLAIILNPTVPALGISAPVLGPWFSQNVSIPAPAAGATSLGLDLVLPSATNWLAPATGTLSLFVASASPLPPLIDTLQDASGSLPFPDGRLVAYFRLFPEVEARLHALIGLLPAVTASPIGSTLPTAAGTPTRPQIRSIAIVLSATTPNTPAGIYPFFGGATAVQGSDDNKKMASLGLLLRGDGTVSNAEMPMTWLRRPVPATMKKLLQGMSGTVTLWAFDRRGRAVDAGAVACWWSWLLATAVGVDAGGALQLAPPGIGCRRLPAGQRHAGGLPLRCWTSGPSGGCT